MAGATTRGFPFPAGTPDDNANQDSIKALADRLDTILSARTAAQITALAGADLWTGRIQRQSDSTGTTNRQQTGLYGYTGSWIPLIGDGHGGVAGGPVLTATSGNPNMGTSPVLEWDWWMLGPFLMGSLTIIWGTGSPTPGTGTYEITLPVDPAVIGANGGTAVGWGFARDASTGQSVTVIAKRVSASKLRLYPAGGSAPLLASGVVTLGAATDEIKLHLLYLT